MTYRIHLGLQLCILLAIVLLAGCDTEHDAYTQDIRQENGLVVILPGIEGTSGFNLDIRRGLHQAGCYRSIPIYNWGMPVPGIGMLIKQVGLGNRWSAQSIAKKITKYMEAYPHRPVYIIGHSGGGGLAVLIAEEMPEDKPVDGLVLLSASISKGYDLDKALARCRKGIVNFYNTGDVGLLGIGTTIIGNIDGSHGPSAGLTGFDYGDDKLYQVELSRAITSPFGGSSHSAATRPGFVSRYVAPWVLNSLWRDDLIDVPVTRHGPNPGDEPKEYPDTPEETPDEPDESAPEEPDESAPDKSDPKPPPPLAEEPAEPEDMDIPVEEKTPENRKTSSAQEGLGGVFDWARKVSALVRDEKRDVGYKSVAKPTPLT